MPGCSFLILAATQRSGSSSLISLLSAASNNVVSLGEVFTLQGGKTGLSPKSPLPIVPESKRHLCHWQPEKNMTLHRKRLHPLETLLWQHSACCKPELAQHECQIAVKVFDFNFAANLTAAKRLLQSPSACVVIIERPVSERYCSMVYASKTHDYFTHTSDDGQVVSAHRPCSELPQLTPETPQLGSKGLSNKFMAAHELWYKWLRDTMKKRRHLDMPFESYTTHKDEALAKIYEYFSLGPMKPKLGNSSHGNSSRPDATRKLSKGSRMGEIQVQSSSLLK